MVYGCGVGSAKSISTIFSEFASLISSTVESVANAFECLAESFTEYANVYDKELLFVSRLNKKKFRHEHILYQIKYIEPRIKLPKYLPYQRRIY